MHRLYAILLATACLAAEFSSPAMAQASKPGAKYYEEKVDLGFRFKPPADWNFIPAQPGDPNLIGKYAPSGGAGISIKQAKQILNWDAELWIVKFDRRAQLAEGKDADGKPVQSSRFLGAKSIDKWMDRLVPPGTLWEKPIESEVKAGKLVGRQLEFIGNSDGGLLGLYAAVFPVSPEVDVALVFNGAGEPKKWGKSVRSFQTIALTFQLSEANQLANMEGAAGTSVRDLKRFELQKQMATNPGWILEETPNYFIVTNNTDRPFIQEVKERLEAIRLVYEETYPPALAEELNKIADQERAKLRAEKQAKKDAEEKEKKDGTPPEGEAKETGDSKGDSGAKPEEEEEDDEAEEDAAPPVPGQPTTKKADPMERSRCSVVRVCSNLDEYVSYGGSMGTAGYWNSRAEELVIFDDKASGGRGDTWATLNHEAFHQYIYYFFGALAPHSWYNEGTGDFYSGYEYRAKRFFLKPFDWREGLIQEALRKDYHQPWDKILRFTQPEYYSQARHPQDPSGPPNVYRNYAQGWAMVYFLRTGKKSARGWNPKWDKILDTYLRTLVITDDLDKALAAAFEGIDMGELEACWKAYILSL